jgi:Peptidase family C25
MRNRLNANGALIWNYSGHGSVQVWASESIFSTGDVATLSNSGKLPFVVAMTCLNGFFGYPEGWAFPSLAEVLLRGSNNGAVAAFMSAGMTEPEGQRVLDQALYEGIYKRDLRTLGSAISYAKQELVANSVGLGEMGKTFLLFGDPAMRLKVPLPTAPVNPTGQVSGQSVTITWGASADANGAPVAGYNVYRSTSPNGPYAKLNSSPATITQYTDSTVQSGTYYYVIRSVDSDGYESAATLEMTVTIGARSVGGLGSGGGGGGGCFVSTIAN